MTPERVKKLRADMADKRSLLAGNPYGINKQDHAVLQAFDDAQADDGKEPAWVKLTEIQEATGKSRAQIGRNVEYLKRYELVENRGERQASRWALTVRGYAYMSVNRYDDLPDRRVSPPPVKKPISVFLRPHESEMEPPVTTPEPNPFPEAPPLPEPAPVDAEPDSPHLTLLDDVPPEDQGFKELSPIGSSKRVHIYVATDNAVSVTIEDLQSA